jgi:anti-sigma factor RsiW
MRCTTAQTWIVAGADGELSPRRRRALDRHLARCDACRAEQVATEGVLAALDGLALEAEVPARLEQRVFREIRQVADEPHSSWKQRWRTLVPAVAAGAVAVLAVVALRDLGRSGPDVSTTVQPLAPRRSPKGQLARRMRVPADPPVALASRPELFVDLPMLGDLEKLQHFDAIAGMEGDDPTAPQDEAAPSNG